MLGNLPNYLTLSRIVAIPALIACFYAQAPWAAFAVFVIASLTDYLDGWLARQQRVVSEFGRLMDPIADKMLVAAALFTLVAFRHVEGIHMVAAIIILLREIFVSGLREYLADRAVRGLPVTRLAKWKTTAQMVAISILIVGEAALPGWQLGSIGAAILWVAAGLTLITGWDYTRSAFAQIGRPAGSPAGRRVPSP